MTIMKSTCIFLHGHNINIELKQKSLSLNSRKGADCAVELVHKDQWHAVMFRNEEAKSFLM